MGNSQNNNSPQTSFTANSLKKLEKLIKQYPTLEVLKIDAGEEYLSQNALDAIARQLADIPHLLVLELHIKPK